MAANCFSICPGIKMFISLTRGDAPALAEFLLRADKFRSISAAGLRAIDQDQGTAR